MKHTKTSHPYKLLTVGKINTQPVFPQFFSHFEHNKNLFESKIDVQGSTTGCCCNIKSRTEIECTAKYRLLSPAALPNQSHKSNTESNMREFMASTP